MLASRASVDVKGTLAGRRATVGEYYVHVTDGEYYVHVTDGRPRTPLLGTGLNEVGESSSFLSVRTFLVGIREKALGESPFLSRPSQEPRKSAAGLYEKARRGASRLLDDFYGRRSKLQLFSGPLFLPVRCFLLDQ